MRKRGFMVLVLMLGGGMVFAGEETPRPPSRLASALIEAHNRERAKEKKPPLVNNARLEAAARVHAVDMAEHRKMSHEGSDGSTPSQRIERQKYYGRRTGENVAEGQELVEEVMTAWMNSPHHRANILGDFSEIGVGLSLDKDGTPYWCVTFGLAWPKLDPARASADLADAINRERANAKKPSFVIDPTLADAARAQADAQARRDGLGPKKGESDDVLKRIAESGRGFTRLGELAAVGQASPDEVVRTWTGSSGQKDLLLGDDFSAIGVGYAPAEKGTPYWVVLLGRPAR